MYYLKNKMFILTATIELTYHLYKSLMTRVEAGIDWYQNICIQKRENHFKQTLQQQ